MIALGWSHLHESILLRVIDARDDHGGNPAVFDQLRRRLRDLPCVAGPVRTVGVEQVLAVMEYQEWRRPESRVLVQGPEPRGGPPAEAGVHTVTASGTVDPERRHVVAVHQMN